MAKRLPTYCGYDVVRVERTPLVLGQYRTSTWYVVLIGDDGQEGRVSVSVTEADMYGAKVPTIEKAA